MEASLLPVAAKMVLWGVGHHLKVCLCLHSASMFHLSRRVEGSADIRGRLLLTSMSLYTLLNILLCSLQLLLHILILLFLPESCVCSHSSASSLLGPHVHVPPLFFLSCVFLTSFSAIQLYQDFFSRNCSSFWGCCQGEGGKLMVVNSEMSDVKDAGPWVCGCGDNWWRSKDYDK